MLNMLLITCIIAAGWSKNENSTSFLSSEVLLTEQITIRLQDDNDEPFSCYIYMKYLFKVTEANVKDLHVQMM